MSTMGYCLAQAYVERKVLREKMAAEKAEKSEAASKGEEATAKKGKSSRDANKVHPSGDVSHQPSQAAGSYR